MLGRNHSEPALFQMVDLESMVPDNHRLRKIDSVLDLRFVHEAVAECYTAKRGRPSIDPELALRMMLLGTLYNLSDRELCDEIAMHAGMRWFCRLNFHDPVPDHSTLSRLRNERWAESGLFDRLFDEVVRQCGEAGLISGRHLSVDGTQIQANASMKSLRPRDPENPLEPPSSVGGGGGRIYEPQPQGSWSAHGVKYSNRTHRSATDPDARLYRKDDQVRARLSYLGHDLIDTKSRVILRRRVSQATGWAERDSALQMLDEVIESREALGIPKQVEILSADAGYGTGEFVADVLERGVAPHTPLLASEKEDEVPSYQRRTFDLGRERRRREKIRRATARKQVRALHGTTGYQVSRKLRIRNEHLFAEGKNEHGLDRARRRGLERVQVQMGLIAVIQNLKRLAAHVSRGPKPVLGARQTGGHRPFNGSAAVSALLHRVRCRVVARFHHFWIHSRNMSLGYAK
jgi:transposase